jgi:hypothetical protein
MTSEDATPTPAQLTLEVYTTPGRPIVSATKSEGPGDIPMWSPSSATLIYGEHDAVLVDVPATFDQTDALADWVESKGLYPGRSANDEELASLDSTTLQSNVVELRYGFRTRNARARGRR